jgi:hypothetical protein
MAKQFIKKYSYDIDKVVGVDPTNFENRIVLENGKISSFNAKSSLRGDFLLTTYLQTKDVITYSFEMEKSLLDKTDIDSYVETKAYEEAGLDETQEYIFKHKVLESFVNEKMLLVEVIIVAKEPILEKKFLEILDDSKYMDFVAYPGFVFEVLYKSNILNVSNDLFIYFTKNEIFMSVYSEGKFLQTLTIPDGLDSIYSKVMDLNIKNFDYQLFLKVLSKKGLEQNKYNDNEKMIFNELSEIFSNIFLLVSNQIYNINRKFSIEAIDRVFISTEEGTIPGISEFSNLYLGLESKDLKFDNNYNPSNIAIDQILFLSMLHSQMAFRVNDQINNFSIFHRPPTFLYRSSGQFISITIAAILLSSAVPIYETVASYILESNNEIKQTELNTKNSNKRNLTNQKNRLEKELNGIKKNIKIVENYINKSHNVIDTIYKDKKGYIPKTEALIKLTGYLNKNGVWLTDLEIKDNIVTLNIVAKDPKFITNFLDELIQKDYPNSVTTGLKKLDDVYISEVKVML